MTPVATDYDEARSDVKESQDLSLEALQSANAPDARSLVRELDASALALWSGGSQSDLWFGRSAASSSPTWAIPSGASRQ
jgi:hypothetical protein